jgi:hypothetical protein
MYESFGLLGIKEGEDFFGECFILPPYPKDPLNNS